MENLGIEFISVFGMPLAFVELARDLACRYVSTGLKPMDYNPHAYLRYSLHDRGTRQEMIAARGTTACRCRISRSAARAAGAPGLTKGRESGRVAEPAFRPIR
jgi:hypothetical protein